MNPLEAYLDCRVAAFALTVAWLDEEYREATVAMEKGVGSVAACRTAKWQWEIAQAKLAEAKALRTLANREPGKVGISIGA